MSRVYSIGLNARCGPVAAAVVANRISSSDLLLEVKSWTNDKQIHARVLNVLDL